MPDAGELTGPKVHVERIGTADSGAGQLIALGGDVLIRAVRQNRSLGSLAALHAIELQDRKGSVARLRFADGAVWLLTETRDDSLLPFLERVAERSLRPGLIAYPPSVSMQVREAIGPGRKRELTVIVLALLASLPVAAVCSFWPWVGYALIVATVVWLAAMMAGEQGALELPPRLVRLQWPVKLALPIILSLAAALGVLHGRQRVLGEHALQRTRALVEHARSRSTERQAQEGAARRLEIARAAADLQLALSGGDAAEIERQATRLRALDQGHAALALLPSATPTPKAPLSEPERVAAVASGLRAARRITADRVRCESARDVADAWYGVRLARPDDPQRREAEKLTLRLERCRARVRKALIDNAVRSRKLEITRGTAEQPLSRAELDDFAAQTLAGFGLAESLALP